jgi:hypothetical protein
VFSQLASMPKSCLSLKLIKDDLDKLDKVTVHFLFKILEIH